MVLHCTCLALDFCFGVERFCGGPNDPGVPVSALAEKLQREFVISESSCSGVKLLSAAEILEERDENKEELKFGSPQWQQSHVADELPSARYISSLIPIHFT